jgi:predicted CoA-binding protein
MKVLIMGASLNPQRYAWLALNDLLDAGHEVFAIGTREGELRGVEIKKELIYETDFHTVTLYLGPQNQSAYYQYLVELHPKRVIFNPGTENQELEGILNEKGIEWIHACTLVMLRTQQF